MKQKGQTGALRIMREIKREAQRSGRGTRWWMGGDSDPRPQELIQQKLTGTPDGQRGGGGAGGRFFVCHPHVFSERFDSLCCLLPSFLKTDLQTLLLGGLKQPLGLWRILPEKTLCRPSRGCPPDPLVGLTVHGAVRAGQGFTSPAPSKSALLMTVATNHVWLFK